LVIDSRKYNRNKVVLGNDLQLRRQLKVGKTFADDGDTDCQRNAILSMLLKMSAYVKQALILDI
jgi:hypothetical protein